MESIRDCAEDLSHILAKLINISPSNGTYPDYLKVSRTHLVYKAGNPNEAYNYRPVSIISIFAKIMESVILKHIGSHLDSNNLFSNTQHGFRAKRSTVGACTDVVEFLYKAVDEGKLAALVLLDLSNAFPTVNHRILLRKLEQHGFGRSVIKWFKSYLEDRNNYVEVDGIKGFYSTKGLGVPQGSVLGPFLFDVYVNDVSSALIKGEMVQYADDTALLV